MDSVPLTFGDIVCRLAPVPPRRVRSCAPLIARVVSRGHSAFDEADLPSNPVAARRPAKTTWAVLHSVSDWEVTLIHPRPLGDSQVDVEIEGPAGEVLHFTVAVGRSKKIGAVYETSAQVVHSGRSSVQHPLAS